MDTQGAMAVEPGHEGPTEERRCRLELRLLLDPRGVDDLVTGAVTVVGSSRVVTFHGWIELMAAVTEAQTGTS